MEMKALKMKRMSSKRKRQLEFIFTHSIILSYFLVHGLILPVLCLIFVA